MRNPYRAYRWTLGVLLGLALQPAVAFAHEIPMAELELRELSRGEFVWSWAKSGKRRPVEADLAPVWPGVCRAADRTLSCGETGLSGSFSVAGVGEQYSAALVRVHWHDGQTRVYTLTTAQPSVYLHGAAEDARGTRELFVAYGVLGVEHILGGIDHLLFVIGLLFLVGFNRRLVGTITAFTLAHSVTLACSVLGLLTLRSAPVEACIALSIVLVAREALDARATLTRRLPALVAFLFGLVHGLGFAGALAEVGLPEENLALPLLAFNLGVEVGQLMAVLAAFGLTRALARVLWRGRVRTPALYAIGVIAAYWSWERLSAIGSV